MLQQVRLSASPDHVQFVVKAQSLPVAQAEVTHDFLLPHLFVCFCDPREHSCDRNWVGEAFASCDVRGNGQHERRVAPAGERDATRLTEQRAQNDPLEHFARTARLVSAGVVNIHLANQVAPSDLRRRHHVQFGHRDILC